MSSFDISRTFKRIVRNELASDLPEIIRRNKREDYGNACATHDFCDANELMAKAFYEAQGYSLEMTNDYHLWLWNKAWLMAKDDQFQINMDPPPFRGYTSQRKGLY